MKKIIACLPLLLIAFASCDKKDESATFQNDLKAYNLNGDVKSVQERSYEIVGGDAKGNLKRENMATYDIDVEFDKNHQLISEKSILSDGKIFNSKTFEHKNKMLLEEEFLPNDVIYRTKYSFNGDNNTIISKRDKGGNQIHKTVNTFLNGNLIQQRLFDKDDQLVERYEYKSDKNGNQIEATRYNLYEALYKDVYEYDRKNNRISEARFDKDYNLLYKTQTTYKDSLITEIVGLDSKLNHISAEKRSYDKKGNLLNRSFQDLVSEEYTQENNQYDASSNLIEWSLAINKVVSQTIKYKYDSHKNITQIDKLDQNGNVQESRKYINEYDPQGNWIQKSVILKDMPIFVLERKIEYY